VLCILPSQTTEAKSCTCSFYNKLHVQLFVVFFVVWTDTMTKHNFLWLLSWLPNDRWCAKLLTIIPQTSPQIHWVQVEQKGWTVELPLIGQEWKTNAATHILDPLEPNMHQKDPKMLTKKKHTKRALKKSGSKHEQGENEYRIAERVIDDCFRDSVFT
jgi:hypothetical protein